MSRTVLTLGTFDVIHPGHLRLLEYCREIAGFYGCVVVALNPDDFVEEFKGIRPTLTLEERLAVMRGFFVVDAVMVNLGGASSKQAIEMAAPDVIIVGEDWKNRDYLGQLGVSQEWLDQRGITIKYFPRYGTSSTEIKQRIQK